MDVSDVFQYKHRQTKYDDHQRWRLNIVSKQNSIGDLCKGEKPRNFLLCIRNMNYSIALWLHTLNDSVITRNVYWIYTAVKEDFNVQLQLHSIVFEWKVFIHLLRDLLYFILLATKNNMNRTWWVCFLYIIRIKIKFHLNLNLISTFMFFDEWIVKYG